MNFAGANADFFFVSDVGHDTGSCRLYYSSGGDAGSSGFCVWVREWVLA